MKEVCEYLKNCGTFYLATVDGDKPQVRPFGAVCEFEGKLYFVTNNQKEVYRQMKANPQIAISGMYKGTWIRLSGEVEEDTRREARVAMMEANPSLGLYDRQDGQFVPVDEIEATHVGCEYGEYDHAESY